MERNRKTYRDKCKTHDAYKGKFDSTSSLSINTDLEKIQTRMIKAKSSAEQADFNYQVFIPETKKREIKLCCLSQLFDILVYITLTIALTLTQSIDQIFNQIFN